jgi:hypothetical protein
MRRVRVCVVAALPWDSPPARPGPIKVIVDILSRLVG